MEGRGSALRGQTKQFGMPTMELCCLFPIFKFHDIRTFLGHAAYQ